MFKNIVFSIVSILIVKGIFVNSAHAVVDPANYNFSIDQLAVFKPISFTATVITHIMSQYMLMMLMPRLSLTILSSPLANNSI